MSKHFTRLTFAAATLAMGISFPLYAADAPAAAPAAPAPAAAPAAAKPAHEAVKKVKHKAHKVAKEATDEKGSAEKRVVWKNGVVFHDVEPTGQAAGTFGAPTSTSDTLKVDISQTAK